MTRFNPSFFSSQFDLGAASPSGTKKERAITNCEYFCWPARAWVAEKCGKVCNPGQWRYACETCDNLPETVGKTIDTFHEDEWDAYVGCMFENMQDECYTMACFDNVSKVRDQRYSDWHVHQNNLKKSGQFSENFPGPFPGAGWDQFGTGDYSNCARD